MTEESATKGKEVSPFGWLDESERSRYVLYPIRFQRLWDMFRKAEDSIWFSREVAWHEDVHQFATKLNDDERYYVKHVLAFFASSDSIVTDNTVTRFYRECPIQEARCFYALQAAVENVHSVTYNDAIQNLVDPSEQEHLFNAVTTVPCVAKKANWAIRWIGSDLPFSHRQVAFAAVEGLFFSGSFAAIFWLKKRGLMPGLTFSNELISRDEGLHWMFAAALHSELPKECQCPAEVAAQILRSAVECELEFVSDALPVRLVGLNIRDMRTYIKFVADTIYSCFGYEGTLYGAKNPWDWMDLQGTYTKANFFQGKDANYLRQKQRQQQVATPAELAASSDSTCAAVDTFADPNLEF
jgi:ribonucleoside-diphosphate reductase subunit M2